MTYLKSVSGRRQGLLCCLAACVWLFLACQKASVNVTEPPSGPLHIKKILVLPFKDLSNQPGEHPDTRSPVTGRIFITGDVAEDAAAFLTDALAAWLQSNTLYVLQISNYLQSPGPILDAVGGYPALNRQNLKALGQQEAADAVLLGFVYRFKERVGKGFSAEYPASVAFDLNLIRIKDGRTIWSGSFDETQQTLGQNLFQLGTFLSRGGRWVTAKDMATAGLKNLLKEFPK